jgi:tetratricopeptide (TPR) repeat protein
MTTTTTTMMRVTTTTGASTSRVTSTSVTARSGRISSGANIPMTTTTTTTWKGRGRVCVTRASANEREDIDACDGVARAREDGGGGGRRRAFLASALAGVASAAVAGRRAAVAATSKALPSLPQELTEPDKVFSEDFDVQFAGLEVDHKNLIYALIFGQTIGFIGSAVGGAEAKKRALEIERLNATLLKVNKEVRKELRSSQGRKVPTPDATADSMDDGNNEAVAKIIALLKLGKGKLKQHGPEEAYTAFSDALALIKANADCLNEPWKAVRKAERGLGAACSRLKKYDEALTHMKTVLELSNTHQDTTVATDAYGIIADIYAEMDQLEVAADWYDKYFKALAAEDAKDGSPSTASASNKGAAAR